MAGVGLADALVPMLIFCMVSCGRLSWLSVSFGPHVKCIVSCRTLWGIPVTDGFSDVMLNRSV